MIKKKILITVQISGGSMSIVIRDSGSLLLFKSFLVSNLNFFPSLDFAVCVLYSSSREAHGSCLRKFLSLLRFQCVYLGRRAGRGCLISPVGHRPRRHFQPSQFWPGKGILTAAPVRWEAGFRMWPHCLAGRTQTLGRF